MPHRPMCHRLALLMASIMPSLLLGDRAHAQAEDCANAGSFPIAINTPVGGNFTGSTNDGPSGCGTTANLTQWWSFTAPSTARYTISMCGSAHADTHLGVVASSAPCDGTITYLGCNDEACGSGSQLVLDLTAGTTYRIRAAAFNSTLTNGGGYSILITPQGGSAPINDGCLSPTSVTVGTTSGTTLGASGAFNPNSCAGGSDTNDVWFSFTPPNQRRYALSVCSSDFDASLSVHNACPTDSTTTTQVLGGCSTSDAAPIPACSNRGAALNLGLLSSSTYLVRVAGASDNSTSPLPGFGAFSLVITPNPNDPPVNDDCTAAVSLNAQSLPYTSTVDAAGALNDADPGTCNSATSPEGFYGVWYRYVAPVNGLLTVAETSTADVSIAIFQAANCVTLGASLRCNDSPESFFQALVAGQTYFILVSSFSALPPTTSYITTFDFFPAPANEDCASATNLASAVFPVSFQVNAQMAGLGTTDPSCNAGTAANADVWWSVTAPASGARLTFAETSTDNDVVWSVYTGTCAGLAQAACQTNDNTSSTNFFTLAPNQTALLQLSRQPTSASTGFYTGVIDLLLPPTNEECAGAITVTGSFAVNNTLATTGVDNQNILCPAAAQPIFQDTWWRYVAPAKGTLFVFYSRTTGVARVAVYRSASCPTVGSNLVGCVEGDNSQTVSVSAGDVVYLQVGSNVSNAPAIGSVVLKLVPVEGRCCLPASQCAVTSEVNCASLGGTYAGDGTLCNNPDGMASMTYSGTGGLIPDSSTAGASFSINVSDSFIVGDAEVTATVTHTWVGDLTMTLTKGTDTVTLVARTRLGANSAAGSDSNLIGAYTFDDDAPASWWPVATTTSVPPGTYRPSDLGNITTSIKNAFNGVDAAGTWTLKISDSVTLDSGGLSGWSLKLFGAAASNCPPSCPGDFNGSLAVDPDDLFAFLDAWFAQNGATGPGLSADLDGNQQVDPDDLFLYLDLWFANNGTSCV